MHKLKHVHDTFKVLRQYSIHPNHCIHCYSSRTAAVLL